MIQGSLARYKGVIEFIHFFRSLSRRTLRLVIAGRPESDEMEQELRAAAESDPRIQLHLRFLEEEELQMYYRAADVVMLPYLRITNSGAAILALSFNKAILCPDLPLFRTLADEPFGNCVLLYPNGHLAEEHVTHALERASALADSTVDWGNWSWDSISEKTIELYEQVLASSREFNQQRAVQEQHDEGESRHSENEQQLAPGARPPRAA